MRAIKLALISFVILFLIITLMSSLLPRDVLVSRAVDINAATGPIQQKLFDLKQWNTWMPVDTTVSFAYNEMKNTLQSGNTEIKIISTSDSLLVTDWRTTSDHMTGQFRIIDHNNGIVTVQWQMEERIGWLPWEKFASITADKVMGGSMEKSLDKLKRSIEQQ